MSVDFFEALAQRERLVDDYFRQDRFKNWFNPESLEQAVFSYLQRSGKRLRPAVLMWCCGAVGGDERAALPAAAGIEMFHTWTLVHDDLIDNDDIRRGGPTVHKIGENYAASVLGYGPEHSREYGRDLAVLTGDSQHAWTISLVCDCARSGPVDPRVALDLIYHLESHVVNTLIEGEMLDVEYARTPIDQLTCDDIVRMLWMKTGVLYEFAARAGAMIGLNSSDAEHPYVAAVSRFASACGTAFQLQDDILGLVGDQSQIGKPVGSDVREGKKTTIVFYALERASREERDLLLSVLGDRTAPESEMRRAIETMVALGAIDRTQDLALSHIRQALSELESLPTSEYRSLLESWARFMIDRQF